MNKVDFTRELKQLYRPSATDFVVVDVPPMTYLMLDGHGDPNTAPAYQQAVAALYAVAYRIKFLSKTSLSVIMSCRRSMACGGHRTWTRSPLPVTKAPGTGR